ncbi:MAG: Membrane protein involved in the export of O-antigen and teichoic acid [Cyanobacteria bacterium RYN_339]|nr:Membrane protein involved in the export of O-antigen and teichoic acid [Cyanobacteria bacterium RYN_339]
MKVPAPSLNISWTLAGNVVYAASQWAMLVLIAKLGDAQMVGQFALGLAVVGPVMLFASLQLRGVQATDASGRYGFGHYLGLRLVTTGVALLALLGPGVIGLIAVGKAFEGLGDVCFGAFQQRERMDLIAKSMILKGVCSLVAMGCLLHATHSLLWAVGGMTAVSAAVALGYDLRNARGLLGSIRPTFAWSLTQLAWRALPLGIVYLLTALTANLPRYFIAHELGTAALGVFAALAYMTLVGGTVVNALGQAASPRLARLHAAGSRDEFRQALAKLLAAGGAVGVAGWLIAVVAGPEVLALAYRPEYAVQAPVLAWLMAAGALGFIGSLLGYAMTALHAFKAQVPLTAAVALATAAGCWMLVPGHGLVGGAIALLLGAAVQCAGGAWVVARAS